MLKSFFIAISSVLCFMFLIYKLILQRKKRTEKIALFVSSMGGVLLGYVLLGLVLSVIKLDLVFLLFALSPFIIGKFVTYKKENLYSCLQIVLIALSIFYAIMI